MQKRILFLGGSATQIPPIKYAKEQGHYVITCDYLPENPGHKLADEYHNISTTDKEAILAIAKKLDINGIVAYASDPAAPTQAYVANKLGLPSNPYESVMILSRKDLFREFLRENNFYVPKSESFYNYEKAKIWIEDIAWPIIVKPTDSSGSKGIRKIAKIDDFQAAFEYALQFSQEKKVVVEEFLARDSYQIGGDGFVVDGKLVFWAMTNAHFGTLCNPLVPTGGSLPSVFDDDRLSKVRTELQRLLALLHMKSGALNFEFQYDKNGNLLILEIAARNGGNRIPEFVEHAMGVDLVKYTVDSAMGLDCSLLTMQNANGFYSYYVVHALEDGKIKNISFNDEIVGNIVEEFMYLKIGDYVKEFNGSDSTVGVLIMKFSTQEEMLEKMDYMHNYIQVEVG